MSGYEVFRRDVSGGVHTRVEKYTKFSATLRMNEVGKWSISGRGEGCPFHAGDGISVLRDGAAFLSGTVTEVSEELDESYAGRSLVSWTADGVDDNGLIFRRAIVPDPVGLDFTAASHQVLTDYGGNAILRFIDSQGGEGAHVGRRLPNFGADAAKNYGTVETFKARFQNVWEYVAEIAKKQGLRVYVLRGADGRYTATVSVPTDKSNVIIFSREFGTLKRWTRKVSAPKANAVWVVGQGELTARMVSYREDPASIARWGRIEVIKDRRDISNEQQANDPRTPQEILDEAAETFLAEAQATEGYELELTENPRMVYRRDWDLGDVVSVRAGTAVFNAPVTEVRIDYGAGLEMVYPTVGTIQRGTLGKTYGTIQELRKRLDILERV